MPSTDRHVDGGSFCHAEKAVTEP